MESSQLIGDAEECSSSESGWTMYLASPMHDDTNMHDDGGDGEVDQGHDAVAGYYCESSGSSNASVGCNEADHGDDSLASDASTGPAQKIEPCSKCDGTDAMDYPKDDVNGDDNDNDNDNEIYSQFSSSLYKRKEKVEKRGDGKSPRPFLKGAGSSRSSSEVRRNKLIGK
ncbi:uncharacterized protein LOC109706962 [Ananas comosus]|uniref:Uncharacterized protein LOC109706962 n=1 Tax=Ananas comosus TaxID=4615 RepID=A0A6P5EJG1_ANACO|nr:uncharacterized protein LOC109706962 [Ananas comosus]XP_020083588.1 uncharacterized protein LOC109706962 [Ananas comosus]